METKLIAAEIATAAGVTTIITSSKQPENVFKVIEYHNATKVSMTNAGEEPTITIAAPNAAISGTSTPVRPAHTVFTPSPIPLRDLKSWTSHTLYPSGSVVIDSGAHHVLSRRESGGRLLAAGVKGVLGAFASGQAVKIVIRRPVEGEAPDKSAYSRALQATRPSTPVPGEQSMPSNSDAAPTSEDDVLVVEKTEPDIHEGDVIEVGRGLANYNSQQILSVKGLNRFVGTRDSLSTLLTRPCL